MYKCACTHIHGMVMTITISTHTFLCILQLMENTNFHKTVIPYDKLDDTYRSRDIHVVMFNNHLIQ